MPQNNAIDSLLRTVGQTVWEVRIMSETPGDTPMDTPAYVTKNIRVYGIFKFAAKELFQKMGFSLEADAVFYSRKQVEMTSQIKHNDILYEIRDEMIVDPLHTGLGYAYILTKFPEKK